MSQQCAGCGTGMVYRLGQLECAACGRLELASPPAVAQQVRRGAPTTGPARSHDPGAQYRHAPPAPGTVADAPGSIAKGTPGRIREVSDETEGGWSGRKWWAVNLLVIGGLGFLLPAVGIQFVVLMFFGEYEFIAAGAFIVIGAALLIIPED